MAGTAGAEQESDIINVSYDQVAAMVRKQTNGDDAMHSIVNLVVDDADIEFDEVDYECYD